MTTALAPSAGTQLVWCQPQTAGEAWTLAETIAKSRLAPKGYESVEQIFIAMQHGAELGLNAMQALQGIAMVNGRPAVWGTTLWALVQRSRLVHRWMKGTLALPTVEKIVSGVWKGRNDANAALIDALVVRLADRMDELKSRKVTPPSEHLCGYAVFQLEDDIHVQLFDSAHAQKAGLLGKQGPWSQYPERMHQHRAVTFLARDACGSALTGIAGAPTAEEVIDTDGAIDTTAHVVVQQRPATVAKVEQMAQVEAGSTPAAPDMPYADALATASKHLRESLDRIKVNPWPTEPMGESERQSLVAQTILATLGEAKKIPSMTADERTRVALAVDALQPPEVDMGPDPDDKVNSF